MQGRRARDEPQGEHGHCGAAILHHLRSAPFLGLPRTRWWFDWHEHDFNPSHVIPSSVEQLVGAFCSNGGSNMVLVDVREEVMATESLLHGLPPLSSVFSVNVFFRDKCPCVPTDAFGHRAGNNAARLD